MHLQKFLKCMGTIFFLENLHCIVCTFSDLAYSQRDQKMYFIGNPKSEPTLDWMDILSTQYSVKESFGIS
jgi:hypothetical protein